MLGPNCFECLLYYCVEFAVVPSCCFEELYAFFKNFNQKNSQFVRFKPFSYSVNSYSLAVRTQLSNCYEVIKPIQEVGLQHIYITKFVLQVSEKLSIT